MTTPLIPRQTIETYEQALTFLNGLDVSAMKLGLSRIQRLLETLGNPQDSLPMVHIAGTNGKGSVTAMLASILKTAGLSVGTFTSPHLVHVRERIAINGNPILPDDFQEEVDALKAHLEALDWPREEWPTYFEFLNVVAYQYFKRKNVDITVFETGLGGRLDSTNVVKHPNLTVITTIGMDHMQHLGDTLGLIAAEKAGILKAGTPLVLGPELPSEAQAVILNQANQLDVPVEMARMEGLIAADIQNPVQGLEIGDASLGQTYRLSLLGPYQRQNLATVLACVRQLRPQGFAITEQNIQDGLAHTHWPGRFQYFAKDAVLLDGSHNADGFAGLETGLRLMFSGRPLIWLVSLRSNRDPDMLLRTMQALSQPLGIVVTQAEPNRLYHAPDDLADAIRAGLNPDYPVVITENPGEAYILLQDLLKQHVAKNPLGVVSGSLYTAGEILQCLERGAEPLPVPV